jgi:hypothetical protein
VIFCAPRHARPDIGAEHKAREEPQIDQELLQHMLSIIKFYYADAASEEQVAGQLLMSGAPKKRWTTMLANVSGCGLTDCG